MSSSEALKEIRQTVLQGGDENQVVQGEYTLKHSAKIPDIGRCKDVVLKHYVTVDDQYTKFGADLSYILNSFYLTGTITHAAFLQVATADHDELDSHMQDREHRVYHDLLSDDEPVPFPGLLNRSTMLPGPSNQANRLPHLHIGKEQLYAASLALREVAGEYPPATLLSVGQHESIPRDWLENYADWLDGK